ncbi:HIT domain protein [Clostridium argentinense CDC 2741]|uniref:HIT domain protein n=1 Tax=Clostridium argentinense CDC 2741 TaxID=1418104 RepID=A0A0C1U1X7_9CLOT|nr:histidine triad nucleotide-binding protein [Clostridium argentinense]ARC85530.1 histidine triad nucleotide-binding protein [Clostridium argentinense]KIE46904.1 HIT domain protein [Clostridium argentinense CDC 2741]NFF40044.1 histidine triad nucleotide-binding protein [Clostridium argentinense]NFP50256.1 histidine triad nucleotide-binding protein [Clostridium argentinense]NFP71897.1 histidine triad nucleotide-binding protein [Clostridium argentinense]
MSDCIFCKIINGEIPCNKVYEDDKVLAFKDINPEAPIHVLLIPKIHIASINDLNHQDSHLISHIFLTIQNIAKELGIDESGYRVVTNTGKDGGQTVNHMHFHLLAGRSLNWPPG